MKKLRKITTLTLAAAMVISSMPARANAEAVTAGNVINTSLFAETFEGYDVGTLAEVAADGVATTTTVGNLKFTLQPSDKVEIAQEENGNKYLKLTRGSTSGSNTTVSYNFPEDYTGGKIRVSYDFVADVHSKHFTSFGVLRDDTLSEAEKRIRAIVSYGNNIYCQNGIGGTTTFVGSVFVFNNKNYKTFSQTVDLTEGGTEYKMTAYQNNDAGDYSRSLTLTKDRGNKVTGINWGITQYHDDDAYNGAAEGDGVYRFDNITVENVTDMTTAKKITEDFENQPLGKELTNTNGWFGLLNINVSDGDKVTVATDPYTGSKALRIEKGSGSDTNLNWKFGTINEKRAKVSYDLRIDNHSKLLMPFSALREDTATATQWVSYKDDFYWSNTLNGSNVFGYNLLQRSNNYSNVSLTFAPGKEVVGNIVKDGATTEKARTTDKTAIDNAYFNFSYNYNNFGNAGWRGNDVDTDTVNNPNNNGIYWIDNLSVEIVSLDLVSASISDGETDVPANNGVIFTFNEALADSAIDAVMVAQGDNFLTAGTDYTVSLSDDKKSLYINPVGDWKYESAYSILISEIAAAEEMTPFAGTSVNFVTGKYSPFTVNDDFSEFELGQKWVGPQEVTIGTDNKITLKLKDGDSVEYAYDAATDKNGFKLTKGSNANLDFIYSFPEVYTSGKYIVKVDERIQNYSKGHSRWPVLLKDKTSGAIGRGTVIAGGYWIAQQGKFNGIDVNGKDWSADSNEQSNYISGYPTNDNATVIGEVTLGRSYRIGLYNHTSQAYRYSVEPTTNISTLGGLIMRMQDGGTNYQDGYYKGTDVDEDTVNNPDNKGIAWIYGVTVEKTVLDVTETSFANNMFDFDPAGKFTITFNELVDSTTVTPDTVKLYKDGELVDSYEYSPRLLDDGKTIAIDPVSGITYDASYTIEITQDLKAKESYIGDMVFPKSYTIKTSKYVNTTNPDIAWSTIPNGSDNVNYGETTVTLSTADVWIKADTITADNIKVYENNTLIESTIAPSGLHGIDVTFTTKKDSTYKITVTGLESEGETPLGMTADYTLEFTTREGDIYTSNAESHISADGLKSVISAELHNAGSETVNFETIGVLKDANGKVIAVKKGTAGNVAAGNVADVSAEIPKDSTAATIELYVWDSIAGMKPLIKKTALNSVNERTYGYDNYVDSSEPLNIVYIGGSITQQLNYTTPLKTSLNEFLRKDNAERAITHDVQGVGGTGSNLGLYRLEKDVMKKNPDIVFIEFAVNDSGASEAQTTMEGMIRKLMKMDHQPMVILLDVTTKTHESLNSIEAYEPLMEAYGIGYVNVAEYLIANEANAENPNGLFVWTEAEKETYPNATALTSTDGTHPTATGGKVYADYMAEVMLGENSGNFFKKMTYVETPVSGVEYNNPRMIPWSAAEYDSNWNSNNSMNWAYADGLVKAKSAGATLTYKFTGTKIGLYIPKINTATSATYSIDDGAYTGTVSGSFGVTTRMPMMSMIKSDLSEGEHTITITVNSADAVNFEFGYFMVD